MNPITKRLRVLRAHAGLSQLDVSYRSGVNLRHYGDIERGSRVPTDDDLKAIAKVLKVAPADILPDIEPAQSVTR